MASAQTLRRCVLRNVECVVCQEPYGSEELGFKIEPVFLQCGHDLCQICSRRVTGSTCPVCRAPVSFSKATKPFVVYIDPSEGPKKYTSNSELAALVSEASKMLLRCERLGEQSSILEIQELAEGIGQSSLSKVDGDPNMKLTIQILGSVVAKLADELDFQTFQAPQMQENALRKTLAEMILAPISSRRDPDMSDRFNFARVDGFLHTPPPSLPCIPASQHITTGSTAGLQTGPVLNQLPLVGNLAHLVSGQPAYRSQGEGSNTGQLGSSVSSTLSRNEEVLARRPLPDISRSASSQDQITSSSVFSTASNGTPGFTFTCTSSTPGQSQLQARIAEIRPTIALRANKNAARPGNIVDQASSTNRLPANPFQAVPQLSLTSNPGMSSTPTY